MKKMIGSILLVILLSGCVPKGTSILDCQSKTQCNYVDVDVTKEDTQMSNRLELLILSEEDTMIYHYRIDPGGDYITIEYNTDMDLTHDNFDILVEMIQEANEVVRDEYDIEEVFFDIYINDEVILSPLYDDDGEIVAVTFYFDYFSYDEMKEYKDSFSEFFPTYLNTHKELLETFITYEHASSIFFYNDTSNRVWFLNHEGTTYIIRSGEAYSQEILTLIEDALPNIELVIKKLD